MTPFPAFSRVRALATAALGLALVAPAAAQNALPVQFEGRVRAIDDRAGVYTNDNFDVGSPVTGEFILDLDADDNGGTVDIFGNGDFAYEIGSFAALAFNVQLGDLAIEGQSAFAQVFDDELIQRLPPLGLDTRDRFNIGAVAFRSTELPDYDGELFGSMLGTFVGEDTVFDSTDVANGATLNLQDLDAAEVTIEFRTRIPGIDPALADLIGLYESNRVSIEILSLSTAGGRIDFVCPADVNEDEEVDFGDLFAWINYFNDGDMRADINLDGDISSADFFAWVNAFQNGSCFAG